MWQPPQEGGRETETSSGLLGGFLACLDALARCLCCLGPDLGAGGEGGQRLLSAQGEPHMSIEASASSPPRLPVSAAQAAPSSDRGPLLKGHGPSSSSGGSLQPAASPPMPLPFFLPQPSRPKRPGSSGGSSSPEGASPKAAAAAASAAAAAGGGGGKQRLKTGGSKLSLLEDEEDVCPTCLDPYSEDNPKVLTRCGHDFHLPCLYEWLERSETCPCCGAPMQFDEIV